MNFVCRDSGRLLIGKTLFQINNHKHRLFSHRDLAAKYQSRAIESNNSNGTFVKCENKSVERDQQKFSLILPPPNVTGHLHIGHAMTVTIQDVLVRWKRSQNSDVEWIPGTDHAGIATQVVVEKMLKKVSNKNRHDIGRKEFLDEIWKWREEKTGTIKQDLIRIGADLNWSREYFTMDEAQSEAVKSAFVRLYEQNLIYRGSMLVNWSCALESTISDIEVENVEVTGPTRIAVPGYDSLITFGEIYDIAYKICDSDSEIIVSTTRPETLLGDVAVAVHSDDSRYTSFRESQLYLWHPFRNEKIPLVFDDSVDKDFGTGAVKITPAHDKFEREIATRHSLPSIQVINEKGAICEGFDHFSHQKRFSARDLMKNELSRQGLLRNIKPHKLSLPVCSRSKDIIELMDRPQWFVRVENLARNAVEAVETGEIRIHPDNFKKNWYKWLSPSHDWCISRQLWWGHQVPAYECTFNNETIWLAGTSSRDIEMKAMRAFNVETLDNVQIVQDSDVLDTWFSSALLPFSAMGWPRIDDFYERNYPLDVMVTRHDILFFWVARMVMFGQVLTGSVPFSDILLHGVLCDANGRKMSKSEGNVITPEQVIKGATLDDLRKDIEKLYENGVLSFDEVKKSIKGQQKLFPKGIPECGTDALRFTLCSTDITSHFINFDVNICHANSRFFNKIWQATRYTITSHEKLNLNLHHAIDLKKLELADMDRYILSRLGNALLQIDNAMKSYNFHIATDALKRFFYGDLCDVYLETTKTNISNENSSGTVHCHVLATCLSIGLNPLSYFAPFVSTELQRHMPKISDFQPHDWIDNDLETEISNLLRICWAIRQLKVDNKVVGKHSPVVHLYIHNQPLYERLTPLISHIAKLALVNEVLLYDSSRIFEMEKFVIKSTAGYECSFGIETNHLYEADNGKSELNAKKLKKLESELEKLLKRTSNKGYSESTPPEVQAKMSEKINKLRTEIECINQFQHHGQSNR